MSRREVLQGAGSAVTFGMLASAFGAALPRGVNAKQSAALVDCMTIVYPAGEGTLRRRLLSRPPPQAHHGAVRQVDRALRAPAGAAGAGGPAAGRVRGGGQHLDRGLRRDGRQQREAFSKRLIEDVPNFTRCRRSSSTRSTARRARAARRRRSATPELPLPEPGRRVGRRLLRQAPHAAHHEALWTAAIKRFELRKGDAAQAGWPPPESRIGSINIYIEDHKAFDAAGKKHGPTLVADVPNFSSVMPTAFETRVYGIGSS
ncbi:MAG: hypothetical protein U1F30_00265 [Steroidobacteraceae bacterium]